MKQKKKSNFRIVIGFLKGQYRFFIIALLCSVCVTMLNALTPQIISVTIDSVLGMGDGEMPALLQPFLSLEYLKVFSP